VAITPQEPGAPRSEGDSAEAPFDVEDLVDIEEVDAGPSGFDRWRRRTTTGAVLTGIALGLQEVFQPPRDEPAIVVTADDGADDPPRPVEVHLDPDDPSATIAVVRPWLGRSGEDPGT
jgi:hypothetical protein